MENENSRQKTVKAVNCKEKPSRSLPTRSLSVVHEVQPFQASIEPLPEQNSLQQSYNNIFILGLLFTFIGFNSAWLLEELLQQYKNSITIELYVFSAGILLLPFMKFRKQAIVLLSLALQCSLLCLQFGKIGIVEVFGDCLKYSYTLVKCSIFTFSIFNIAFGTIYEFLR
ncbi:unnamed protein product [Oikopleura dioica]|uniref:Uncharacterized protein n=1 Tax=Oikopleura dioica TaxID=34765 RepID=E4Y5D6_OIKDI|nr:unnamed protein product [Oikopleura dioica]